MQRSKIIVELIRDEINVVQAMNILNLLLQDNNNEKIKRWLNSEINGYKAKEKLPQYRIISSEIKGNVVAGYSIISNMNIPIKKEFNESVLKIKIRQGINEILQYAKAEEEIEHHNLSMEIPLDYLNSIALINGQVTHAHRELSIYAFTNIINSLKPILLNILQELEKVYGNLDNYYIDMKDKEKKEKVDKVIINIIDNSINIGDQNKIEKTNIGDSNENRN